MRLIPHYEILDVESTTHNKGNPFDPRNKLCLVGLKDALSADIYDIEHGSGPYADRLKEIKGRIERADVLVGFNIKFDLHWIRKYIPDIQFPAIWDCQLGHYLMSKQTMLYPSLDGVAVHWKLKGKGDSRVPFLWDQGFNTTEISREDLDPYLNNDLNETEAIFKAQWPHLQASSLFNLHCRDLLVLQEMEFNGLNFNYEESKRKANQTQGIVLSLTKQLEDATGNHNVNWGSPQQVSAILYGGTFEVDCRVTKTRVLKDGTVRTREINGTREVSFPRLINPLKQYDNEVLSVGRDVLRKLKCTGKAKEVVNLLLSYREHVKLVDTYYNGLVELVDNNHYDDMVIHGNLSQSATRTGRLASSRPNLQNFAGPVLDLFCSNFN